jgi:hypothetical protein
MVARLRIQNYSPQPVHSMRLHCQIQLEPGRRSYNPVERAALQDVFGTPEQWRSSIRPLIWARRDISLAGFETFTVAELPFAVTSEFSFAALKYLAALEDGDVPLSFLFSGMVFYSMSERPQIAPIPWDTEARFRLPVSEWKRYFDGIHDAGRKTGSHKVEPLSLDAASGSAGK